MIVTECYGKNIFLNDEQVGYVSRRPDGDSEWYIMGRKVARMTYDGKIAISGRQIGCIDDNGDIFLNGQKRGELGPNYELYLTSLN